LNRNSKDLSVAIAQLCSPKEISSKAVSGK